MQAGPRLLTGISAGGRFRVDVSSDVGPPPDFTPTLPATSGAHVEPEYVMLLSFPHLLLLRRRTVDIRFIARGAMPAKGTV